MDYRDLQERGITNEIAKEGQITEKETGRQRQTEKEGQTSRDMKTERQNRDYKAIKRLTEIGNEKDKETSTNTKIDLEADTILE